MPVGAPTGSPGIGYHPPGTRTIVGELLFATLGVTAFAVVASTSEKIGKVLLYLMLGFLVIFLVSHGTGLADMLGRLNSIGIPSGNQSSGSSGPSSAKQHQSGGGSIGSFIWHILF
jgi:hypothetical protein